MFASVNPRKRLSHPLLSAGESVLTTRQFGLNSELALPAYYLIPDTHMDFGWFAPNALVRRKNFVVLEEVRQKLGAEADYRFSLEAIWMLEAYGQQASPRQFESLKQFIDAGQVSVAPHYVLLDDRLAGEKAQIYNVLVGRRVAGRYGIVPSTIFCAKDMFGLDAQTPQRERKLGNDMVFRARGDVPEVEDAVVHVWLGADGKSWIYDVRQTGGYGSGVRLGHQEMEASATIYSRSIDNPAQVRDEEAARTILAHDARYGSQYRQCNLPVGALYNGCDYERVQKDIGEVAAALRERFPGVDFRLATFEEYGQLIRCLDPQRLIPYQGAFYGRQASEIRDVDMTRIPTIKVPYVEAMGLLADAEALSALAAFTGRMEEAQGYLTEIWKGILAVGTHDYLSGSVTDYVMPEISFYLWETKEKARRIIREALGRMATGLEVRYNDLEIVGETYSLINLATYPQKSLVELPVPVSLRETPHLQLKTETGAVLPVEVKADGLGKRALAVVEAPGFGGVQATLEAVSVSSLSSAEHGGARTQDAASEPLRLENEYLVVEPFSGGLLVKNKQGAAHRFWFDLVRDRGDTYTAEALNQPPWDSRLAAEDRGQVKISRGNLLQSLSFDLKIRVPQKLSADRLSLVEEEGLMTLTVTAHLAAGLDHLHLELALQNSAVDDYILRLLVNSPTSGPAFARDNFMVRPVSPLNVVGESWQKRNSVYDFDAGGLVAADLVLAGKGLFAHRIEANDGGLTIIKPIQRGIGYVSCDDLVKRKGAAAAHREIPQAQCHGEYGYSVYLSLNGASMDENMLVRWSEAVLKGLTVGMAGVTLAQAPQVLDGNAVITGIKQPEDGSADLIYHIVNYGSGEAYLVFDRAVEPCLLNEEPLAVEPSPLFLLGPYEFGAVRVRCQFER